MKVNILGDAEWQSGVGEVLDWLATTNYWEEFEIRDYGPGLDAVVIGLICRDPQLNFKRRVRHSRKDKAIYLDVMLNLADFIDASNGRRRQMVLSALLDEVPQTVAKYDIENFGRDSFMADFVTFFTALLGKLPYAMSQHH